MWEFKTRFFCPQQSTEPASRLKEMHAESQTERNIKSRRLTRCLSIYRLSTMLKGFVDASQPYCTPAEKHAGRVEYLNRAFLDFVTSLCWGQLRKMQKLFKGNFRLCQFGILGLWDSPFIFLLGKIRRPSAD